jgi:regulatory protein
MDSKCNLTFNEAKLKLESWCAYQDRCTSEVILKLKSFELSSYQEQKLIDYLTINRFLDDQRYSNSIVSGKFSIKKWGRIKITYFLKKKYIPKELIRNALSTLDEDVYFSVLLSLAEKKHESLSLKNSYEKRAKVVSYLQSKGYELDLIIEALNEIKKDL